MTSPTPRSPRWHSMDVLKGLALWGLLAHHFQRWVGGPIDDRFIGFDHMVVTDLAAPLFAVALGAAAVVVGARIHSWDDLPGPMWRWAQVLLVGIGIDLAVHREFRGTGVLPTLAILGACVMLLAAVGVRHPWVWWTSCALCAVLAVPATRLDGDHPLMLLLNGPFALPVYGVFATGGAAVAAHGLGRPERDLPLIRAALGVLAVGVAAGSFAGGLVAPHGFWPPARYPGHLEYTLWGLVASFAIWAAARAVLPAKTTLGAALGRAGKRTLLVFAAQFGVEVVLTQLDVLGELDTWRWGMVAWLGVAVACALSTIPNPRKGIT